MENKFKAQRIELGVQHIESPRPMCPPGHVRLANGNVEARPETMV